jgi:mannose-6-phosphate isomerase
VANLRARLGAKPVADLSDVDALVLRLIGEYGDDIGCFCPYLLNYVTLQPGEAVFLGANEPHAYLSGDCVECMACSDNVVRAGLTPKFIDKETLYEMLTYRMCRPAILLGDRVTDCVRVYSPPVPEFEVEVVTVRPSSKQLKTLLHARHGASVLLVVSGAGSARLVSQEKTFAVGMGQTYLIGAGETVEIHVADDSICPLVAYRAFPNESLQPSDATQ